MKILWIDPENPKFCIGILDENNYVCAKLTKSKGWESFQWFDSIRAAVLRVCKLKADDQCTDLSDWLIHFNEMLGRFEALLIHVEPQAAPEKRRRTVGKASNSKNMNSMPSATPPPPDHPKSGGAA